MAYKIVLRSGNTGKVVGKAKTKAGAYKAKVRCEKKHNRTCVVMTSTGYVDPSFAGFGSSTAVHVREAARALKQARFEKQIVSTHLARGECRAAVRGLAFYAYAEGRGQAHKMGANKARRAKGRTRNADRLIKLADRVVKACGLDHR
jgi:hypothetical protein